MGGWREWLCDGCVFEDGERRDAMLGRSGV